MSCQIAANLMFIIMFLLFLQSLADSRVGEIEAIDRKLIMHDDNAQFHTVKDRWFPLSRTR
jgi:hypothetical protein